MHNGFIFLWRKSLSDFTIQNHKLWALWSYLLLTAQYLPTQTNGITISPGQLLTTLTKLSAAVGLTRQEVRTGLKNLKIQDRISTFTTRQHTLITIVKWPLYQTVPPPPKPQPNQTLLPAKKPIWIAINNLPTKTQEKIREQALERVLERERNKPRYISDDKIIGLEGSVRFEMEDIYQELYIKKSQIGLPL